MIDQNEIGYRLVGPVITAEEGGIYGYHQDDVLLRDNAPFTRSDGSIVARLYERLTKASRRLQAKHGAKISGAVFCEPNSYEIGYRKGVYDAYKALQKELND